MLSIVGHQVNLLISIDFVHLIEKVFFCQVVRISKEDLDLMCWIVKREKCFSGLFENLSVKLFQVIQSQYYFVIV